ncbi:hypothetical protein GW931_01490 [archaeon]|nr:hypothetical protein [archaeon]
MESNNYGESSNLGWYYFGRSLKLGQHHKNFVLYLSKINAEKKKNISGIFVTRRRLENFFEKNPKFDEKSMGDFKIKNQGNFFYFNKKEE